MLQERLEVSGLLSLPTRARVRSRKRRRCVVSVRFFMARPSKSRASLNSSRSSLDSDSFPSFGSLSAFSLALCSFCRSLRCQEDPPFRSLRCSAGPRSAEAPPGPAPPLCRGSGHWQSPFGRGAQATRLFAHRFQERRNCLRILHLRSRDEAGL